MFLPVSFEFDNIFYLSKQLLGNMKFIKIIVGFFIVFSFVALFIPASSKATDNISGKAEIIVFVREGCGHCQEEERFLTNFNKENNNITVNFYRLENASDRKIWDQFTTRFGIAKVTPITVIGKYYLIGFSDEKTSGEDIIKLIQTAQDQNASTNLENPNLSESGLAKSSCPDDGTVPCRVESEASYTVSLPFLGKIDTQKYPLVFLSALLGFFDGFNPCAMWVLLTFLIILIEVGDRRKMFAFAGIFILAEAVMYTLILTVWYNTWDFVKLDTIVTPIVGFVSVVGGILFLKEYRKKELECKVTNFSQRAQTKNKIRKLATDKFTFITFLGILGIAFSVNIIEFACSIGIPQAFTKILELNRLSVLPTAFMIAVYILFYMIDDLVVFGIALYGAEKLHLTTRYSKLSNLLGGIVMIILGLLLLFSPRLLFF